MKVVALALGLLVCAPPANADEPATSLTPSQLLSKPDYPEVTDSGFVLIEIWPRVKDITLSAYFLDRIDSKSRNLCEAIKSALDREQDARARAASTPLHSYRMCMTIRDAAALGWIHAKES